MGIKPIIDEPNDLFIRGFIWSFVEHLSTEYCILIIKQIKKLFLPLARYNVNEGQNMP